MRSCIFFLLVFTCISCRGQIIFGGGSQIDDFNSIVAWYRLNSCFPTPDSILLNTNSSDLYDIEVELSKAKSVLLISFKDQVGFRQLTKNRKFVIELNNTTISGKFEKNKRIRRMKIDYGDGMIVHVILRAGKYELTHESTNGIDYSKTAEIYKANVEGYIQYYSKFILYPLKFCE